MADAIIPNFGDDEDTDRKFVIICSKGNLDMAYPALVLANAALGEGIETHLFFTFWGFDMIIDSRMDDLKFTAAGNTAMHLPIKGREVRIPQAVMPLPGMTGMATKMLKDQLEELDLPNVRDFLDQIVAAGGHLWACRLSADMNKVDMDDLYEGVDDIINASDFIEMTDGAQLLFI
jgi:peroxiredoxin family protein